MSWQYEITFGVADAEWCFYVRNTTHGDIGYKMITLNVFFFTQRVVDALEYTSTS